MAEMVNLTVSSLSLLHRIVIPRPASAGIPEIPHLRHPHHQSYVRNLPRQGSEIEVVVPCGHWRLTAERIITGIVTSTACRWGGVIRLPHALLLKPLRQIPLGTTSQDYVRSCGARRARRGPRRARRRSGGLSAQSWSAGRGPSLGRGERSTPPDHGSEQCPPRGGCRPGGQVRKLRHRVHCAERARSGANAPGSAAHRRAWRRARRRGRSVCC
jgi:hypothetical protein